eukprot:5023306-Prymnesium_polylepis.1
MPTSGVVRCKVALPAEASRGGPGERGPHRPAKHQPEGVTPPAPRLSAACGTHVGHAADQPPPP